MPSALGRVSNESTEEITPAEPIPGFESGSLALTQKTLMETASKLKTLTPPPVRLVT